MSWQPEVDERERRAALARQMGGGDSVAFQHGRGKLTVRERIDLLADEGTFAETGELAGRPTWDGQGNLEALTPANSVTGIVRIGGRKAVVHGGDFTIRGGASDGSVADKAAWATRQAYALKLPYIRLLDATGGSVRTFEQIGRTYLPHNNRELEVELLQRSPVISAVLGSVAGLPAVQSAMCHFNVMVKGTSQVFVAGPAVVTAGTGATITKEDLGNEDVQVRQSGVIANLAETEADAFAQIRRFLSYLPANAWEIAPRSEPSGDPGRDEGLLSIIPRNKRRVYDPYRVLDMVLDQGSFFEIQPLYGRGRITGLARVDGYPVGVMINNPKIAGGSMDKAAGEKMARLLQICDTFHLPLVYFCDEPGFSVGLDEERQGIIRAGARIVSLLSLSQTPYITFIMRQAYGVAGGLHYRGTDALYRRFAWPSGHWGSMHIEGGVAVAYRREIDNAPDPAQRRAEIEARLEAIASPFRTAHSFELEDIIDPRDTRRRLVDFVEDAQPVLRSQLGTTSRIPFLP